MHACRLVLLLTLFVVGWLGGWWRVVLLGLYARGGAGGLRQRHRDQAQLPAPPTAPAAALHPRHPLPQDQSHGRTTNNNTILRWEGWRLGVLTSAWCLHACGVVVGYRCTLVWSRWTRPRSSSTRRPSTPPRPAYGQCRRTTYGKTTTRQPGRLPSPEAAAGGGGHPRLIVLLLPCCGLSLSAPL